MSFTPQKVLFEETIPGGWNWSHILKKGTALRLTDLVGGACGAMLLYNPGETSERYNMPDTLKAQFTARITMGHALYSDMGRIFVSVIGDTVGWHDPLGGLMDQSRLESRFGVKSYQDHRNDYQRSGKLALLTELSKYGLGRRDFGDPVNFFAKVMVAESGALEFQEGHSPAGSTVDLQAEMDTLVVLAATQHPRDPRKSWEPKPLKVQVWTSQVPLEKNPAYEHSDQNRRGFRNTFLYQL